MKKTHRLDKKLFYQYLEEYAKNKFVPIWFDMPINKEEIHYRLIFDWQSRNVNGMFNPIMTAQFVDIRKSGMDKYFRPDMNWDCQKEGTTTDYKVWLFLDNIISEALKE